MTFNPGIMGIDPQQLQAAREMGKHIKIEIKKCPREGRLEVRYIAISPQDFSAQGAIPNCVETMAIQMAMLLDTMFGMKGKIIHEE